jgi:hypothetical protein
MAGGRIIAVDFRGDSLFAVEREDGIFVALKPICDSIGLKWSGQHDRVNRDAVLSEGIRVIRIPSIGGRQEAICLRLDLVNGWLFTIDESRVKTEEIRERVLAYKRDCHRALFEHFFGRSLPRATPEDLTVAQVRAIKRRAHALIAAEYQARFHAVTDELMDRALTEMRLGRTPDILRMVVAVPGSAELGVECRCLPAPDEPAA